MIPGSHTVVITADAPRDGIQARTQGYELRDTLVIFMPGQTLHALLLRTPLSEKTVAAQVLATGTGALNIDGTRISAASDDARGLKRTQGPQDNGPSMSAGTWQGGTSGSNLGRWPTNVLLVHGPTCVSNGTRKVKGGRAHGLNASAGQVYGDGKGLISQAKGDGIGGYVDDDGQETIQNWDCQPNCPVKLLDAQSGDCTTGAGTPSPTKGVSRSTFAQDDWTKTQWVRSTVGYGDTGGASRFYPQFESLAQAASWLQQLIQP